MFRQRPGTTQAVRDRTLVAAQRGHDGCVGSHCPLVGGTAQHQPSVLGEGGFHQRGLANAGVAGDQQDPAIGLRGYRDRVAERGLLPLSAD